MENKKNTWRVVPKEVWVLGAVSLLMDVSSEMIHSLLPLFMTAGLGFSAFTVGIIEGVAESTALIVKVFSGALSDYLGKRKFLTVLGYTLGALSKPFFALAQMPAAVFGARIMDRIGKGIRGAPRDAMIADVTPPNIRGVAFGIRQSLDTAGAFIGPLLAVLFMFVFANNFRAVFWVAVIPAFLCVALLIFGVKEPHGKVIKSVGNPVGFKNLKAMGSAYWAVVIVGGLFSFARFSEAFLVLRARDAGVALAAVPAVMVCMNIIFSVLAYPFGKLSDSMSHRRLLAFGIIVLFASNIMLSVNASIPFMLSGICLWGLHLAITQGLISTMIAAVSPEDKRGTGFGFYNLVAGIAMLCASVLAGYLWQYFGAQYTFYTGAALSVIAFISVSIIKREKY